MNDAAPRPRRPRQSALERARQDLASGRPDLARDRLTGYLYTLHRRGEYQAEAYLLLGQALYAMKDYARAGAAWLLTEHSGPEFDHAISEFHRRYGTAAVNVLRQVKPRAPSEDYPPAVQARLRSWDYRYRTYRPRSNPHAVTERSTEDDQPQGLRGIEIGCLLFVLGIAFAVLSWLYVYIFGR